MTLSFKQLTSEKKLAHLLKVMHCSAAFSTLEGFSSNITTANYK